MRGRGKKKIFLLWNFLRARPLPVPQAQHWTEPNPSGVGSAWGDPGLGGHEGALSVGRDRRFTKVGGWWPR